MAKSFNTPADVARMKELMDLTGVTAATLGEKQAASAKGQANGFAGLDGDGKVPLAQLPTFTTGMSFQSTWNAATNTPAIPAASAGNKGYFYIVSTAGTTNIGGITDWKVTDWVVSIGTAWVKIDNTDGVASVAGLTGAISSVALRAALAMGISDIDGLADALAGKVDGMIDVDEAPTSEVIEISFFIPGIMDIPAILTPAETTEGEIPFDDTDGRTPYTPTGNYDTGGTYNPLIHYTVSAGQWLALYSDGETSYTLESGRSDLTLDGFENWPWTLAGGGEFPVPEFTAERVPSHAGAPGQIYRRFIGGGRFIRYEKQPDGTFLSLGEFDSEGNEYVNRSTIRRVPEENWATYKPKDGEVVAVGSNGCTAVGDGLRTVKYLPWSGPQRVTLDEDFINSAAVETGGGSILILANSGDVEVQIVEDIKALGYDSIEFLDYSRSSPSDVRIGLTNFKYAIACNAAQTGGSIQFAATLRLIDPNVDIFVSDTGPIQLVNALRQYDYANLVVGSYILGTSYGVLYAHPSVTFGGA